MLVSVLVALSAAPTASAQIEAVKEATELNNVTVEVAAIGSEQQFKIKMLKAAEKLQNLERIYANVKDKVEITQSIYDVATFITKNSQDISNLYASYKNGIYAAEDLSRLYARMLEQGNMSPSDYAREMARLSNDLEMMTKDLENFVNVFLKNDIKMSFMERFEELKELFTKWDKYNIQWRRKKRDLLSQHQKDSIRAAINAKIRRDAAFAYGIPDPTLQRYQLSDSPNRELLYENRDEKKKELVQSLKIFTPNNIFGIVWRIIFIISGILVPMAIWLYFKGDGQRHNDAPIKIIVGLLVTILIMLILQSIFGGSADLNFQSIL